MAENLAAQADRTIDDPAMLVFLASPCLHLEDIEASARGSYAVLYNAVTAHRTEATTNILPDPKAVLVRGLALVGPEDSASCPEGFDATFSNEMYLLVVKALLSIPPGEASSDEVRVRCLIRRPCGC